MKIAGAAAAVMLIGWAGGAAADSLDFFSTKSLSFEPAEPGTPAAPIAERPTSPSPDRAVSPGSLSAAVPRPAGEGVELAEPPAPPPAAGVSAPPVPAPAAANRPPAVLPARPPSATARPIQVIRVRHLSAGEKRAMAKQLTCATPLAADVVPGPEDRAAIAEVSGLRVEELPKSVAWIFGMRVACVDRSMAPHQELWARLDDAARRATRRAGY